jgi:hypothetical protein
MEIEYQVGDTVEYTPMGGGSRIVVVTDKDDNIKNGRPGFEALTEGVWGYDDQIVRVVEKAS